MTTELDIIAQNNYARREARTEGLAEGRAEGLSEGRAEGEINAAKKIMEKYGLDPAEVAKLIGVQKEDLE